MPDYVEENARTRLAMRWPEYHLAEIERLLPGRQLVSIDSIDVYMGQMYVDSIDDYLRQHPVTGDTLLAITSMAEIRFTCLSSGVNGVNVQFDLVFDLSFDTPKIVAIDMVFAEKYRDMRDEIERRTAEEELTIELVDSVVDAELQKIR